MTQRKKPPHVSRRDFAAMGAAAGLAMSMSSAAEAVTQTDVTIKTPDGLCDAAFFHPATARHPGVIVWTDIFGLRPSFRALGKRLAAQGYAVLIPNPFYRTAKAPVVTDASSFDFADPASRAKTAHWTKPLHQPGAIAGDSSAYIAWLDAQPQVDPSKKIGTQGYCMGGPLVFRTAAANPGRVGAGATFHGGGLVTDKPDSPHLLIPEMKSQMYIAIAASDDAKQPDAKTILKSSFAAARLPAQVQVYDGTFHGWTVPDMPRQRDGTATYNRAEAERAFTNLLALYKRSIA